MMSRLPLAAALLGLLIPASLPAQDAAPLSALARMPVTEFALKYKDVYKLELPITPPRGLRNRFDNSRQAELARLLQEPKVMHNLRLTNDSKHPLTTAPVLILKEDTVLAQGLMTYTPVGGDMDLPITAAMDIVMRKSDKEDKRVPNVERWEGNPLNRVELSGQISLTNRKDKAVNLEVTRYVLGNLTGTDAGGKLEMMNGMEDVDAGVIGWTDTLPVWWNWYDWPGWWNYYNGLGKATWTLTLEPGKKADLSYSWNYLWR